MKKSISALLILTFVLAVPDLSSQDSAGQQKTISLSDIDQYINTIMETNGISGLSANIVRGDEMVWSSSYGLANRATNMKVEDDTPFLLYSVTKSFTGVALMHCMTANNISLDAPINDYLPFQVKHPSHVSTKITFKMLMGHVSGIKDNWGVINQVYSFGEDTPITLGSFLKDYFTTDGAYYSVNLNFAKKPGTTFLYSNIGATLAGYLVECISGQALDEYCTANVFQPLGMNDSHYRLADYDLTEIAVHYDNQAGNYKSVGHMTSPVYPAGFMRSTNKDMAKWLRFIMNGGTLNDNQVLAPEDFLMLHTPSFPAVEPRTGLFMAYDPEYDIWGHTGGLRGIRTCYFVNYEENWGISVLANGYGDPYPIFYFLMQAASEFEKLTVGKMQIEDDNENGLIEKGEGANIKLSIRNNMQGRLDPLRVEIKTDNPDVNIISNSANLEPSTGNMVIQADKAFQIIFDGDWNTNEIEFDADFYNGDDYFSSTKFYLPVGVQKILLIHDEHHAQKNMANSIKRYKDIFNDLNISYSYYDMSIRGIPSQELLLEYQSVYWMTGLDNSNNELLPVEEQEMLKSYLDKGGKLFLSGQNINDQIGETDFFTSYLHSTSTHASWTGNTMVFGNPETEMGINLAFNLNGGESNNSQYSPSGISPDNEALSFLKYFQSNTSCGISYDGDYKLIYLSFGLEGIDDYEMAKSIIHRADQFFNRGTNIDLKVRHQDVKIYPLPFTNDLFIQNLDASAKEILLNVSDYSGRVIKSFELDQRDFVCGFNLGSRLNLSELKSGIYFLIIEMDSYSIRKKIVKL